MKKVKDSIQKGLDLELQWREIEEGLNTIYEEEDGNLIVKIHSNDKQEIERFRAEPEIYKLVSDFLPVPEIIFEDLSEEETPAFYVMEKIEGENASEAVKTMRPDNLQDLMYEYGKMLAQVHSSTDFEKHGLIMYEEGFLMEKPRESWKESFKHILKDNMAYIQETWDNTPEFLRPEDLVENIPEAEPVLLHHDNRLENIILNEGEIGGFLDWSFTRVGHSEYDLILAEYLLLDWELRSKGFNIESLRKSLYQGYRNERELVEDEAFERRRAVYRYSVVLWLMAGFSNWGPENPERYAEMEKKLRDRYEKEKMKLI